MRHALITAGTKGLGKQVTEKLLAKGYSVTVTYHSDITAMEKMKEAYKNGRASTIRASGCHEKGRFT